MKAGSVNYSGSLSKKALSRTLKNYFGVVIDNLSIVLLVIEVVERSTFICHEGASDPSSSSSAVTISCLVAKSIPLSKVARAMRCLLKYHRCLVKSVAIALAIAEFG